MNFLLSTGSMFSKAMHYPAASCEVSEDRNGMIMPLTLPSPAKREGTVLPRSKLRGIIQIENLNRRI